MIDRARPASIFPGYVFDLDGTLYLGDAILPGAAEAVRIVRSHGARVAFLTNKPLELPIEYAAKLRRLGIPAEVEDVVSSTDALRLYLREHAKGARIFPVSEPVVADVLRNDGFELTEDPARIDVVVVSFDRTFDYAKLLTAFRAVRHGARIVATNPDPYCPTPDGGLPDCAAMLAAIEVASGGRAEAIVGKPSVHMSRAVLERLDLPASDVILVGDRLLTDIRMAHDAGMTSALVMSGVTTEEELRSSELQPDFVLRDIGELVPDGPGRDAPTVLSSPAADR